MFLRALGKVWAAPTSLVGLGCGLLGWACGGNAPAFGNNAIEFTNSAVFRRFTSAVTLGHVILYSAHAPSSQTRLHEKQHTVQAELLGVLYLPAHAFAQIAGFASSFFHSAGVYRDLNDRVHGPGNILETGPTRTPPQPWPWRWVRR